MATLPAASAPARALPWRRPQAALGLAGLAGGLVVGAGAGFGLLGGLAALVVCSGAVLVAMRPAAGLLVLAAVVPIVAGLKRGLPVPGLRLSEIAAVGIAGLVLVRLDSRSAPPWRAFDWAALAYAAGTLVIGGYDVLARGDGLDATSLGTLFGPFQFLLLYRAALSVLVNEDRRVLVLRAILLASVVVSVLALLQRFSLGGVDGLMTTLTGVDAQQAAREERLAFGRFEETLRTTGPFPHWQVLAGYLVVVALLATGLLLEGGRRVLRARWLILVLALAVSGMVASGTFTTTLGLVLGAVVLGVLARRLPRVLAALAVGGALLGTLFWSTVTARVDQQFNTVGTGDGLIPQSINYRIDLWQDQLLPLLDGRWLTGYGPVLPPGLSFPYTESVYLTLLLRGGVILLALYALLMIALFAAARRDLHHHDPLQRTVARVVLVLVALLVPFHLLEPYFLTSGMPQLFWLLAAMVVAGTTAADRHLPDRDHSSG